MTLGIGPLEEPALPSRGHLGVPVLTNWTQTHETEAGVQSHCRQGSKTEIVAQMGILAKEEFDMSRYARWFVLLLSVVACAAFGQAYPKGFRATKSADFSRARALPFESPDQTLFENVIIDGQRYAMVAAWKKNKLEPIGLYPLATVKIPLFRLSVKWRTGVLR